MHPPRNTRKQRSQAYAFRGYLRDARSDAFLEVLLRAVVVGAEEVRRERGEKHTLGAQQPHGQHERKVRAAQTRASQ